MLHWGLHITQVGDPLHPITVEEMYSRIQRPKAEFQDRIQQLRAVRILDEKMYRELKKGLPYFVCGSFHPAVRRRENFAAITQFVLDLDHLSQGQHDQYALAQRLSALPQVELCFVSPGGDGLKLMFRLSEPCRDSAQFSAFYKVFAHRFAVQQQLEGVVDLATHDVTRACFVSYDPAAYFRPEPESIEMADYLTALDFELAEKEVRVAERAQRSQRPTTPPPDVEPGNDILRQIKQKLNPRAYIPPAKQYVMPPELDAAIPLLRLRLAELGLELESAEPINYGRKLRVKAAHLWAEINLFYGQRGFTVVKTTKSGSHAELAELAARAVGEWIHTKPEGL